MKKTKRAIDLRPNPILRFAPDKGKALSFLVLRTSYFPLY